MNESTGSEKNLDRDADQVGRWGSGARVVITRRGDKRDLDLVKAVKSRYAGRKAPPK
jgi:predicted transport protein